MANPNPPQKQLNIKLDEKVGEGTYANFFMITNSPSEFILDCGRILPGLPDARIYTRVVMTPSHAKQLLQLLEQNIATFEKQHGEVKVHGQNPGENKGVGFKTNPA
ncbi:MAG: DUF3467 domain-containing protein [Candidatus Cloacimonetes bacterium]|jgi:hypothetical protein|nr:DUF3467 domain-containing protein [Candidatus Cloacimonadota bacterium]MDD2423893.1 DUF3467 domain-containing protein [Candidatus Cloacimonadota bacterium]MDD3563428.1 DUF3467 domain-containing protein [Candidatus Cloacimonadota bacterium]MDD4278057.1 DUF3467 domain-containing protein [Candidatus Cloacimonadota bacterium]MDY0326604.1 DUF3467 domain-containing protein [Candidatus Cloacimonadaceae bacterium]